MIHWTTHAIFKIMVSKVTSKVIPKVISKVIF